MQAHHRRRLPPSSLGRISRPFYLRSHATPPAPSLTLVLSIYPPVHATTDTVAPITLLFPPRGTLTPFRRRQPPPVPSPSPSSRYRRARRYRSSSDGIPGATTPTIDDPAEGGDRGRSHVYTRAYTDSHTYDRCSRARKSSKKCSAKAGLPVFRRGAAAPGHRYRVPPSFLLLPLPLSPSPGLRREYMQFSLAFSRTRCYVARYVFNTGQLVGK